MDHFDHEHTHDHVHEHTHDHVHEHTHTDEQGHTYTHSHEHTHEGEHSHAHGGEQTIAVLKYMLEHNIHHAAELNDMARQFDGEAQHQLLHAVESFDQANGYLSAALELLKEKQD